VVDFTLPFGTGEVRFEIAQDRILDILLPRDVAGSSDTYSTIRDAIQHPIGNIGLASMASRRDSVCLITDDFTRPTPAGVICEGVLDELNKLGIPDSQVTILAAGGLHRPMTEMELRAKYGGLLNRVKVITHDAWNENGLEYLGETSRGTPVWINRLVAKANLRLTVGMITAHFVAGYGSGPKTIMPGASGYKTIFHNHGVIATAANAMIGVTEGNPCWEDMAEVVNMLGPTLAVDVVLNVRDEVVAAFHGIPTSAQKAGIKLYNSIYGFRLKEKADIVIASANPMYSYLDQCLKAIVHSSMLVKDGGTRIVAAPCQEHLGPDFLRELYYASFYPKWPSPHQYAQRLAAGKINDIADAVGILKFLECNNSQLTLVCDDSFDSDLTKLGFNHAKSVQIALEEATAKHGRGSHVLVVPYAAVTHPVPS